MTRKFKTAEKNRVNYVYYTADGKKIVITPGENGVTEEMITLLHTYDDEEVDAERREDYHVPVRFEGYSDDEGSELESRNSYLADSSADPLEKLMEAIKEEELETKIGNLKTALSTLTEKQRETIDKKFFKGMTNTAIKPLVYICAPYSSDKERNIKKAVFYAEVAYKKGAIPVTPHFLFPFMNDEDIKQRKDALFMDIILLGKCQEVWVFGNEITEGMKRELEVAEKRKQAIRYFNFEGLEVKTNAKL